MLCILLSVGVRYQEWFRIVCFDASRLTSLFQKSHPRLLRDREQFPTFLRSWYRRRCHVSRYAFTISGSRVRSVSLSFPSCVPVSGWKLLPNLIPYGGSR